MALPGNTYIVLEIPSPFAEMVIAHRQRHRDSFRFSLPAETTLSGSSGTGPLAIDQDLVQVIGLLDGIARQTEPTRARFGPVKRFEKSDVFYLSFVDERPLRALHERIATSGLRFQPTTFAFTPHCTIRTRTPVSEDEVSALERVDIAGEFLLDTLSLYDLPLERGAARTAPDTGFATLLCLLHRTHLGV